MCMVCLHITTAKHAVSLLMHPVTAGASEALGAQMQQENGNGEVSSAPGLKRKGVPLTEEERRTRRKEINRESARRIRKRKNNEMEGLKQQVRQAAAGMRAYPGIAIRTGAQSFCLGSPLRQVNRRSGYPTGAT